MNLTLPTPEDIAEAYGRILPYIRVTPLVKIAAGELGDHPPMTLKLELIQHSGAFKARGAFHNLLTRDVPEAGVAAASGGNHGAAVAVAANRLGYKATIFVPEISSPTKIAKIRVAGADVVIGWREYADAAAACDAFMAETGAIGIHAYDGFETLAGQGTIAVEWQDQGEPLDTVVVAVGGGGLVGGVASAYAGSTRVIAVETEGTPTWHESKKAGRRVDVAVSGLAADSLGAKRLGALAFEVLMAQDIPSVLVSDDDVRATQRVLWDRMRLIAEPGGAAALAAILSGRYVPSEGETVGILVCGANTDPGPIAHGATA